MAGLVKQTFTVPFIQGVDTKSDPKMLQPGKLTACVDGIFSRDGALISRNGYEQMGAALPGPICGAGVLDKELDVFVSGAGLYAWSPFANAWISKGYCRAARVSSTGVVSDATKSLRHGDSMVNTGIIVHAWVDPSTQSLYAAAYDASDGTQVVAPAQLATTVVTCQVIAESHFLYVFYSSGTSVIQQRLDVSNPTAGFAAPGTVVNTDLVNHQWSAMFCAGTINKTVIAWRSTAGTNKPKVATVNAGVLGAATLFGTAFNDFKGVFNLGFDLKSSSVIVMAQVSTGSMGIHLLTSALVFTASFNVGPGGNFTVQTASAIGNTAGTITVFWTQRDNVSLKRTINSTVTNPAGANLGTAALLLGFEQASEAFSGGLGARVHLWVRNLSPFQPTYFCVDEFGNCIAKALMFRAASPPIAVGGSVPDTQQLGRVWSLNSNNQFSFSAPSIGAFESDPSGQSTALAAISRITLDVSSERFRPVQVGHNLIINGGVLSAYDGSAVTELNFHLAPETPAAAFVANWLPNTLYVVGQFVRPNPQNGFIYLCISGGTSLNPGPPAWSTIVGNVTADNGILWVNLGATDRAQTDGTRTYYVVYENTDAASQVHRSGQSLPVSGTLATGGATDSTVVLTIPTLKLTAKQDVRCVVYRTLNLGTVAQRVGFVANNPATDVVYFIDGVSDATLASAPSGYFVSELAHVPPPSGQSFLVRNDRLYIAAGETPNVVTASQFIAAGEGVSFGVGTELDLDQAGGSVVGLAMLDEKLVVLKDAGFYAVVGDGPSNNGSQNDWSTPQAVPADCGCFSTDSILTTPMGVWFQSTKGLRLLDRSMSLQYVGREVEALAGIGAPILGAAVAPGADHVRFVTAAGTLNYDSQNHQWSVFSLGGVASVVWNGSHLICRSTTVGLEALQIYSDFGAIFNSRFVSGWINLAEIAGYGRLYRVGVLVQDPVLDGTFGGQLQVGLAFRADTSPSQLNVTDFSNAQGGMQVELIPNAETTDALQVTLALVRSSETEDLYLNALTLEVGQKARFVKLPGNQRYG